MLFGPVEAHVPAERFRDVLDDSEAEVIISGVPRRSVLALRGEPDRRSAANRTGSLQASFPQSSSA